LVLGALTGAVLACDSQETGVNYFRFWPKANIVANRFVGMYAGNPTLGEAFSRRLEVAIQNVEGGSSWIRLKRVSLSSKRCLTWLRRPGRML